jgi:hypothetical protein
MTSQEQAADAGAPLPIDDNRMSFDDAVQYVMQRRAAAFAVTPVFDDDHELAAGARVFLLAPESSGGYFMHFIAGPFFSAAYAANEKMAAEEIPERVREMRFLPTRFEEDWLSDQVQLLIQKLMQASGAEMALMPDYKGSAARHAAEEVVFHVAFIGKGSPVKH